MSAQGGFRRLGGSLEVVGTNGGVGGWGPKVGGERDRASWLYSFAKTVCRLRLGGRLSPLKKFLTQIPWRVGIEQGNGLAVASISQTRGNPEGVRQD